MTASQSLAGFLDELAGTLKQAAEVARAINDPAADLPATLGVRHVAKIEGISTNAVWKRAKLGRLGPTLNGPGEALRWDRDQYLEHRRRRQQQAAEA